MQSYLRYEILCRSENCQAPFCKCQVVRGVRGIKWFFFKKRHKVFFKLENDNFYSVFVCYELKAIVAIFGLVDEEENSISSIINEPLPPSNSYIFVVIFWKKNMLTGEILLLRSWKVVESIIFCNSMHSTIFHFGTLQ